MCKNNPLFWSVVNVSHNNKFETISDDVERFQTIIFYVHNSNMGIVSNHFLPQTLSGRTKEHTQSQFDRVFTSLTSRKIEKYMLFSSEKRKTFSLEIN